MKFIGREEELNGLNDAFNRSYGSNIIYRMSESVRNDFPYRFNGYFWRFDPFKRNFCSPIYMIEDVRHRKVLKRIDVSFYHIDVCECKFFISGKTRDF